SSVYVFYTREPKTPDELKLMDVIESTGATILSREAYFWARPKNGPKTAAVYDTLIPDLAEALDMKMGEQAGQVNITCNENLWEMHANGTSPDGDMINISGRLISR